MTARAPIASLSRSALHAAAAAAGLTVSSSGCWPETEADGEITALAGFIDSQFSPLLAEAAARALRRRPEPEEAGLVTAVVMVTALGDVTSAARVAAAVDSGRRVPPLHFFQSVPNAVAGYLAARWQLTGPVVCVSEISAGLDVAALLIEDADADEALVVRVELTVSAAQGDHAAAIVVRGPSRPEHPGPA